MLFNHFKRKMYLLKTWNAGMDFAAYFFCGSLFFKVIIVLYILYFILKIYLLCSNLQICFHPFFFFFKSLWRPVFQNMNLATHFSRETKEVILERHIAVRSRMFE